MDDTADPSLAARLDARRLGTAMAMIIPRIATTISSSIREKPASFFFLILGVLKRRGWRKSSIPSKTKLNLLQFISCRGHRGPRMQHGLLQERFLERLSLHRLR